MPAPHHALSEALIVLAALWVSWRIMRRGAWFGALGIALFGSAAAIGAYRFGSGQIDALAEVHRAFSQIGGATAMALVALQCLREPRSVWHGRRPLLSVALVAATLIAGLLSPELATPIFVIWLLIAIGAAVRWPAENLSQRMFRGGVVAIFLLNILLVRRSATLGPDLSWHLFHVLIAVWILGIWWLIERLYENTRPASGH